MSPELVANTDGKPDSRSQSMSTHNPGREIAAIFVHCGAGFHSFHNEDTHLAACNDAAKAAIALLRNGGSSVDAVEMAIKVLEDREITNAGYGSNLALDGVVEGDACVVDHQGRSGAVGAVAQIKNPISLARMILDFQSQPLPMKRVPPNILVAQGATDFAYDHGFPILPHDALVSPAARERWMRWKADLAREEKRLKRSSNAMKELRPALQNRALQEGIQRLTGSQNHQHPMEWQNLDSRPNENIGRQSSLGTPQLNNDIDPRGPPTSLHESSRNALINSAQSIPTLSAFSMANARPTTYDEDVIMGDVTHETLRSSHDGSMGSDSESSSGTLELPSLTPSPPPSAALEIPLPETPPLEAIDSPSPRATTPLRGVNEVPPLPPSPKLAVRNDEITDTVGAIAVDCFGNIAAGASSGGIGMKFRGRIGPAALLGAGAAVIPVDPDDKQRTTVATCTSGTGEQICSTMAAKVCAERLYHSVKKGRRNGNFEPVNDDEAIKAMIEQDFMGHPSVKYGSHLGAFGILAIKKTKDAIYLYYAHNTDSFAVASQFSNEPVPVGAMSRNCGAQSIAQGGRAYKYPKRPTAPISRAARQAAVSDPSKARQHGLRPIKGIVSRENPPLSSNNRG